MNNMIECSHCKCQAHPDTFRAINVPEVWCEYCGGENLNYVSSDGFPYCANPKCGHMMHWGSKPEGVKIAHPELLTPEGTCLS